MEKPRANANAIALTWNTKSKGQRVVANNFDDLSERDRRLITGQGEDRIQRSHDLLARLWSVMISLFKTR
ncbi:MAG TPA: hypothetical protein PKJ19_10905 [Flavobacteriales bacterium]|nr:hypothetical protein [Flavobacteriales bacterium]HNU57280.1 hypothetical protein [Flavobacteriales bacterium]